MSTVRRPPSPADLLLAAAALRLAGRAQAVARRPLPEVARGIARVRGPRTRDTARAVLAARRAGARGARWFGWLDTCLTRSLVVAGLLRGRRVVLRLGFRPPRGAGPVDGHAWLEVDGERVEVAPSAGGYESVASLPLLPAEGPP